MVNVSVNGQGQEGDFRDNAMLPRISMSDLTQPFLTAHSMQNRVREFDAHPMSAADNRHGQVQRQDTD